MEEVQGGERTEGADENLEEEPRVDGDDPRLARSKLAVLAHVLALELPLWAFPARKVMGAVVTIVKLGHLIAV